MLLWLAYNRGAAISKLKGQLPPAPRGVRGPEVDALLPDRAKWASHNYTHLLEQPTIFYAVVLILAMTGAATTTSIALAWGYTVLRIAHSVWQALVNHVQVRFALFLGSTFCLIGLAIFAVLHTLA
jgi:hypothetical protein